MTKDEAIELLEDLDGAIEDNHGRDYDEAFRMAIEALSAEPSDIIACEKVDELDMLERMYLDNLINEEPCKSAEQNVENVPSGDLVSRQLLIGAIEKCGEEKIYPQALIETIKALPSAEPKGAKLINRHDATEVIREECWKCNRTINDDLFMRIMSLPTSQQTDCTDFILWLIEIVLDEEDWELNAVGYGEIIARQLKKLGLLEVKDGYYIRHIENNAKESDLVYRPSADRPKGEWVVENHEVVCSVCGQNNLETNFCPNCGADMRPEK